MLIALAVVSLLLIPLFPALAVARENQRFAEMRHLAQARAERLAAEVRDTIQQGDSVETTVHWFWLADESGFAFRVRVFSPNETLPRVYNAGEGLDAAFPPVGLSTAFAEVENSLWILAEVFDGTLRAGLAVRRV